MTEDNSKTQQLMWKYKEEFVMKELGDLTQDGELDFILAIIDDSPESVKMSQEKMNISRSRYFINCLRTRMNNKENFVILLEIFNKLFKFQAYSFLRQPLAKLILDEPEFIILHDKENERDYIKALNIQEIIYSIICNKRMKLMRKFLKSYFPFKDMFKHISLSVERLDQLEELGKISDNNSNVDDYDELRDYQYFDLTNIYTQVYLNTKFSTSNKEDIANDFISSISIDYIKMLNDFNLRSEFSNPNTFKKSTLRFLMIYMQAFIVNLTQFLNSDNTAANDLRLNKSNQRFYNSKYVK